MAHPKETLNQEPRVKNEGHLLEKYPFSGKCLSFKKISGHFRAKNFVARFLVGLNHPCLFTSTSTDG